MRFGVALLALALASCRDEKTSAPPQAASAEPPPAPAEPLPEAPLVKGDTVRDFEGLAHTGQRFRISEFLSRPVLVYFCPSDRTPECQALALTLRDHWLLLNPSLSMAFGVTPEDSFAHGDFASEKELSHLLVADAKGEVHAAFGLRPGVFTATLIGPERKLLEVWNPPVAEGFPQRITQVLEPLGLARPVPPI